MVTFTRKIDMSPGVQGSGDIVYADHINELQIAIEQVQSGAAPIALAGIEGALGEWSGFVNVLSYGAVADAAVDNRAAFQSAVTAAAGSVLYVPPGTYGVAGATDYDSIIWLGTAGTAIWAPFGATIKVISGKGCAVINLAAANQSVVGLTIDGNSVTEALGVHIRNGAHRSRVSGDRFTGLHRAVYISGTQTDIRITDNSFVVGRYGVLVDENASPSRLIITNNTFDGSAMPSGGDAIEINTPNGLASDIVIANNAIDGMVSSSGNNGLGIGVAHGVRCSIIGNVVRDCGLDGIHIEDDATDCTIIGNVVTGCGRSGISAQTANTTSTMRNFTIANNVVDGCGLTGGEAAIELSANYPFEDCVIDGNIVAASGRSGATFCGIVVNQSSAGIRVTNNVVRDLVGATTVGVWAEDATDTLVMGNRVKGCTYGVKVVDTMTDVQIAHNHLKGNASGAIDESSLGVASGYTKLDNVT